MAGGRADAGSRRRAASGLALDWAIALASIVPLLLTAHLPLTDLPNHLGRQYVMRDLASSPVLQQFYEIRWELVPNLALDIFVTAARAWMSIDLAVRLFCIVTLLMLFFGTRAVNRALAGPQSRLYRFAPLLLYGGPFQFGFLNYCFSVGLALLLFGLYLRLRRGPWPVMALLFTPLSFALLVAHLSGFGFFVIALVGFELAAAFRETGGWSPRLVHPLLVRCAVIFLFLAPTLILYKLFSPVAAAAAGIHYNGIQGKIDSLASVFLFSSPLTELPLLIVSGLAVLAALFTRTVRLHPAGVVLIGIFALAFMVTPRMVQGSDYADWRVPWGASFFALGCLVPGSNPAYRKPFAAAFAAMALLRVVLIGGLWISWEPVSAAIDTALGHLPTGARLMVVAGDNGSVTGSRRPPLANIAGYAVARRQAFESNIFADIPGQILFLRPPYRDIRMPIAEAKLDSLAPEYDYVLVLYPQFAAISPALKLRCVEQGPLFRIFKVVTVGATEQADGCAAKLPPER